MKPDKAILLNLNEHLDRCPFCGAKVWKVIYGTIAGTREKRNKIFIGECDLSDYNLKWESVRCVICDRLIKIAE